MCAIDDKLRPALACARGSRRRGSYFVLNTYESGSADLWCWTSDAGTSARVLERRRAAMELLRPRFSSVPGIPSSIRDPVDTEYLYGGYGIGHSTRLTNTPRDETEPSLSPIGTGLWVESDRSGRRQLYGHARGQARGDADSVGEGRYGTRSWWRGRSGAFNQARTRAVPLGVMR